MANDKIIEAEIIEDEVKMKEEPEKLTLRQKIGRAIKRHWKGAVAGGLSMAAASAGSYYLGFRKGKKTVMTTNTMTNESEYLEEGHLDENPEV